jgi:hypothetical protein
VRNSERASIKSWKIPMLPLRLTPAWLIPSCAAMFEGAG